MWKMSESLTYTVHRPLLDDSPRSLGSSRDLLGRPGPLPGFWCWVTFSPYSSQNREGCGTPSFCQQFMARIITAIQSTQEEFQLRWTRNLKEAVNPCLNSGDESFLTSRPDLDLWSILWVVCYLPVWRLFLLPGGKQSAPRGRNSFPEPLFRFCC